MMYLKFLSTFFPVLQKSQLNSQNESLIANFLEENSSICLLMQLTPLTGNKSSATERLAMFRLYCM